MKNILYLVHTNLNQITFKKIKNMKKEEEKNRMERKRKIAEKIRLKEMANLILILRYIYENVP